MNKIILTADLNLSAKLRSTGFSGLNLVLDAACGSGNWSYILSGLNKLVIGFDNSADLIKAARKNYSDTLNLYFICANLLNQPFKNLQADAIICADSLMFANPAISLNNFHNILKQNGIVYISVNGIGWILNVIINRGIKMMDRSKINMGFRIILDTLIRRLFYPNYKIQSTVYTLKDMKKIAERTGFEVIYAGYEGTYNNPEGNNYKALFDKTYLGIPQSLEFILKKH